MLGSSKKLIRLFIGIFIFFVITYVGLDMLFSFSNKLTSLVENLSPNYFSVLTIVGLLGIDILVPVPSSIIMVVSGHLFGGMIGGVIAIIGSLIASVTGFLVSRKVGQIKVIKWLGEKEYNQLSYSMSKYGAILLLLTRSIPLVMESVSCIAGLSKMRLRNFILINIIGYFPLTFLYTFTGALAKDGHQTSVILVIILGFFVPVIVWFLFMRFVKLKKREL